MIINLISLPIIDYCTLMLLIDRAPSPNKKKQDAGGEEVAMSGRFSVVCGRLWSFLHCRSRHSCCGGANGPQKGFDDRKITTKHERACV